MTLEDELPTLMVDDEQPTMLLDLTSTLDDEPPTLTPDHEPPFLSWVVLYWLLVRHYKFGTTALRGKARPLVAMGSALQAVAACCVGCICHVAAVGQ